MLWWFKKHLTSNLDLSWKKLGLQGSKFLTTFLKFSKLISSLKAQEWNISENYTDIIFLLNNIDFKNYSFQKWFLHKFHIFINKSSRTWTKVSLTVPNLPSNDEITRFDGIPYTQSSIVFHMRSNYVPGLCWRQGQLPKQCNFMCAWLQSKKITLAKNRARDTQSLHHELKGTVSR